MIFPIIIPGAAWTEGSEFINQNELRIFSITDGLVKLSIVVELQQFYGAHFQEDYVTIPIDELINVVENGGHHPALNCGIFSTNEAMISTKVCGVRFSAAERQELINHLKTLKELSDV